MATPVAWRFGPWATGQQQQQQTQQQSPYADVSSTPIAQPPEALSAYGEIGGGGRGGPGITGTAQSGPMTAAELGGLWGGAAARKGVGMGIGALMGQTPSMGSLYGMAPLAGVTVASMLSSLFGGVRETDPEFGIATPMDIQNEMDYGGQMKGQAMAAEAAAQRASVDSMQKDIAGVNQPDWNGPSDTTGGTTDGEGTASGESGGHGAAGDGSMNALGGVRKAFRGSNTATFGEAGDETGIFIPEMMKRPGIQGNESQVTRALRKYLAALQR